MTTAASVLVDETLRLLHSGGREEMNRLNGAISNTTTETITLEFDLGGIREGAVLGIDQELLYVWAVGTTTATCQRGFRGSTPATHADDSLVMVNPRFSRFDIFTAINHDLDDLSANGLYQTSAVELTYNAAVQGYDLTGLTNVLGIIEVRAEDTGNWKSWPTVPRNQWRLQRNSETDDFASGLAIQLYGGHGRPGKQIRVVYKAPFTSLTNESSVVETVSGLPATAIDLPPLGAALRLTVGREVRRNFDESQGDTRRPDEVPPGANVTAARSIASWRRERIEQEKARLATLYADYVRV